MPWREVIRLMLKKRLAVACFFVIVTCGFFALTADIWVSEMDLQSNAGVDNEDNYSRTVRAELAKEFKDDGKKVNDPEVEKEIDEALAERMEGEDLSSLTGLERSYHPPGWWLALNSEHDHWKKTGSNPETKDKNAPIPEAQRDWGLFSGKAWRFPLGCDIEGVSILAKLTKGLQLAFIIGIIPTLISSIIAVFMGMAAGYFGKLVDDIIVYIISTLHSIPLLLLLLAFIQAVGGSETIAAWFEWFGFDEKPTRNLLLVLIVIGVTTWIGLCRLIRAEVIKHKDREYVHAARALGYGTARIMFRHILPNVFHLVIITFTLGFVGAIGLEVFLSYVGIGVEAELPTWGQMISGGRNELQREPSVWWPLTFATVFLFIVALSFSLFGDALRDALDPKLRT